MKSDHEFHSALVPREACPTQCNIHEDEKAIDVVYIDDRTNFTPEIRLTTSKQKRIVPQIKLKIEIGKRKLMRSSTVEQTSTTRTWNGASSEAYK